MKLDRNYNIETAHSDIYSDSFDKIVDLVAQAKEEGKITNEEVKLILSLAIKRQNQEEIKSFFSFLFNDKDIAEKQTLFIHFKTKNIQYA